MNHHSYQTENTCSSAIDFDLDGDIVKNVRFTGGCNGNLQAIPLLVEGMKAEDVIRTLGGIRCGRRPTSCTDQLAIALEQAVAEAI